MGATPDRRRARPRPALRRTVGLLILALGAVATLGSPVSAAAREFYPSTFLLSRSATGGLPNGASCCGVVSHDERIGRVMAFESWASDITPGARYGVANVYAVFRKPGAWSDIGSPWTPGRTVLLSHGLGGRPANGPSWDPQMSGDSADVPRCVAFLSRASNLLPGDHGHLAQAFVEDLASRRIQRVSVNSAGVPADRDTTEITVSGDCRRVAFVSRATNLAQTTSVAAWRAGRTERPRRGTSQVYVRFLTGSGSLTGLTMLASARGGRPADTAASAVSLSRNGDALAFSSAAADLAGSSGGVAQVWERIITPTYDHLYLHPSTRLISSAADGTPGNAPSTRPSIDHDGAVVAFESLATNLLPGANGVSQILRATVGGPTRPALNWVSQPWDEPETGDGPSHDASITDGGEWIFFDSTAGNLDPEQVMAAGRVAAYRWSAPELVSPLDRTHIVPVSLGGVFSFPSRTPASHPDTSARGNYVPFESDDPGLDPGLPAGGEPPWYAGAQTNPADWFAPHAAGSYQFVTMPGALESAITPRLPGAYGTPDPSAGDAAIDPRLHQAYVRFVGSNGDAPPPATP